ncbi:hypothetical protein [Streptomyces cupreus]|uniref:Uncharacterized protein n=1 Tax=Streptomyces cupreus TaxID=2759956 RepID=A0A7X1J7P5_9ACTN|nr:hypothetical protein [Streptomyces cupreus]MBC2903207.1 hypothetical protein [Streptomyces cupreus]
MATFLQTLSITQPSRVVPLHKATLPQTEFVDSSDDVWVPNGHTSDGELLLACPNPHNPEDAGHGASYPWTLHEVQQSFGPLIARSAVAS